MKIPKIGMSKIIQNFIKKTQDKKFYDKFNRNIPIIETGFAGMCYCGATYFNKRLDKKRKPAIMWQNIMGCLFGMTVSKVIDNSINKFKNSICDNLKNSKNIPDINNVTNGFRVALPLITTATITRFLIPVLLVPISTKIEEIRKYEDKPRKN